MLSRIFSAIVFAVAFTVQAAAGPATDLAAALHFKDLFEVLEAEGIKYGQSLEKDLFPGQGGRVWSQEISRIHQASRLEKMAVAALEAGLKGHESEVAEMQSYLMSEAGQRIMGLEIAARRAYLDDHVKEVAELAFDNFGTDLPSRIILIEALVEANDLIEQNVAGGMNSNMAFYQGMRAGGALGDDVPEADMMADIWSQEGVIREETENWLMPYLAMAYRPVSDSDLRDYVTFSASPVGQLLNQTLFAALDQVFVQVSRELGVAAAERLTGEDI